MSRNETLLKQEIVEAEDAFNEQKLESEKLIQRLEENLLKSKEKCSKVKEELTEANSTLFSKTTECENVKELLESKEKAIIVTKQRLKEMERNTEQQQLKIEEMQNRIGHLEVEKDNAERQLRIMSGQSNTALAEKVQEAGDLRIQLNAAQNAMKAEKRKHDAMSKVASEVQAKCAVLENQLSDEISKHRLVIESMNESHRSEMSKLTKDSKLVTEALNVKATTLQKSIRYIASVLHKLSHENTQLHREVENFPVLLKEAIKRTGK
uniref:Uncharacterized protein n=1 Tax=Ciona savignyi TaxID=51511 RepID=H2ZNU9_CIOSA